MKRKLYMMVCILVIVCYAGVVAAQRGRRGGGGGGGGFGGGGRGGGTGGRGYDGEFMMGNEPIQPLPEGRLGVPTWDVDVHFKSDEFTFVRLRFTNHGGGFGGRGRGGTGRSWLNDWPPADLDLSFRLQQLTSIKVNPDPLQLEITDPKLFDYPFAFMLQVGALEFTDEEVRVLRRYLLNGGFIWVDDHWGLDDQRNWHDQLKRIFPEREPRELTFDHPIFHCVFDLKEMPQVQTIQMWNRQQRGAVGRVRSPEDPNPHYRATYDDKGRIMLLEAANTDTSDGWEREGDDKEYFTQMSEKMAYPFAVNVIFYAMTH